MGKVLETLIKERIGKYLNDYKLIKGKQHRFTKGRSCLTNALMFYEAVHDWVDEGSAVDVGYVDFQKAFNKVPQRRLLAGVRACTGVLLG